MAEARGPSITASPVVVQEGSTGVTVSLYLDADPAHDADDGRMGRISVLLSFREPAFRSIGAAEAGFSAAAKLSMVALMVLGRLEIYTALVILPPRFWRR
jgi:hypothetical protein